MRKAILAILVCLVAIASHASGVGTWRAYSAYNDVTRIVPGGTRVYVLASGGLYSYNTTDTEVRTYDKVNTLSGSDIAQIAWCSSARRLVVVYANGNMDLLGDDDTVVNIPDFYNKIMSDDKTIFGLSVCGRYAYVCTGFGVLKVDVKSATIADTYKLGTRTNDVAVTASDIYVATKDGVYTARLTDNLVDHSVWRQLYTNAFSYVAVLDGNLYFLSDGNIYLADPATATMKRIHTPPMKYVQKLDDRLVLYGKGYTRAMMADQSLHIIYKEQAFLVYDPTTSSYWMAETGDAAGTIANVRFTEGSDKPEYIVRGIAPDGPSINLFGFMLYNNGRLLTVPGINRDGAVQQWDGTEWSLYDTSFVPTLGHRYDKNVGLAVDPTNPSRVLLASWTGLYEFIDGKMTHHWNKDNSPLLPAYTTKDEQTMKNYTVVHSVTFDSEGTAWLTNPITTNTSLFSLSKDGTLTSHHHAEFTVSGHSMDRLGSLMFDSRGLLWMGNNDYRAPYLICYNPATDGVKVYDKFYNQDGVKVNLVGVAGVAEDADHNIWVASDLGPLMLSAQSIASGDATFQQIKVPRNDGTNLADYLLTGVPMTAVVIDGGNRKWFATSANGAYLIGADNMTELEHFTSDNSPLLDNNVESICIDGKTGEVFFGTASGLCSYMGDATEPIDEMTKDNVYAFPNPVRPDYTGPITETGLTINADVKIVTANGALVAEGRSSGGTFTWDGCDKRGKRVASGVYMVETATQDGGKGTVCKIAIVN